mgnify:CR=1 FL=1
MSLDMINHKLTTSTVDNNGVTWWENPAVSVKISSTGKVYSKKSKKINKAAKSGNYSVYINGVLQPNRFTSLYSRMVLGVKLGVSTIALKNPNKGYSPDNVTIVIRGNNRKKLDSVVGTKTKSIGVDLSVNSVNSQDEVYYTYYEAKEEYITEDGGVFPSLELAEWHQDKVSNGKGNAQVVFDYNGGLVLAEQIFLQEVVYCRDKPYENFKDVMENNKGVVSNIKTEECVFDKVNFDNGLSLPKHELDKVKGLKCSKEQALKINEALINYSNAYKEFDKCLYKLDSLLKQV